MPTEILMPALSPTMEKGTLAKWLVKEGDEVKSGDLIAEIETDKATMELESVDEGRIGRLVVAAGTEDVPVNAVIAVLLEEGESDSDIAPSAKKTAPAAPEIKKKAPSAPPPKAVELEAPKAAKPDRPADSERVFASPLARRIAAEKDLALDSLQGSGPRGRIVKRDVEAALEGGAPAKTAAKPEPAAAPAVISTDIPHEEIRLSAMRKTIAKRLEESKRTIPHFYLTVDIEIDKLLAMRKEINGKSDDVKLSVNDFVIRACALALKKLPAANVQYAGDKLLQFRRVDISVAVAVEGGLVTPVIRGAETKGVGEISAEMRALAEKARTGKLMPEEYQGGCFSISNLGMYGIKHFDAVINPPQAAILAVGAGEQRPVVKGGALAIATVMTVTLSCDHRAIDGAVGADFLKIVKGLLEDPLTMLL